MPNKLILLSAHKHLRQFLTPFGILPFKIVCLQHKCHRCFYCYHPPIFLHYVFMHAKPYDPRTTCYGRNVCDPEEKEKKKISENNGITHILWADNRSVTKYIFLRVFKTSIILIAKIN